MSDPKVPVTDPWHHPNPNYQGIDFFALDFVRKREAIMERVNAAKAAALPKESSGAHIKESEVQADIAASNAKYQAGALKREMVNSYYNHPLILHDFATGRAMALPPGQGKGPALIIGSGPTLDNAHELIRTWQGGIFCSTSQGITLAGIGAKKFFMAAVDVKTEAGEFMPIDIWDDLDVTLITHPGMDPSPIQLWRGKKMYFRILVHGLAFYTEIQPTVFPMIPTTMYVFGCAISSQVMMAALMGYNPLFLVGCDFAYVGGQERFRALVPEKVEGAPGYTWRQVEPQQPKWLIHAKVTYRNGEVADSFTAYYKQTFFNAWRLSLADIFVVGPAGGLYEVPHVSIEEAKRFQGKGLRDRFISKKDKEDICERYLLQYGTYTFEYPNGQVEFVVFNHNYIPTEGAPAQACLHCGKQTAAGPFCDSKCFLWGQIKAYIDRVNESFEQANMPGRLILGDYKSKLAYLADDEAWERKEKRWQWEISSQQSPTETSPGPSSESASESTPTTGMIS